MLLIPFISNGQDNRVYWLHGFGGGTPWQIYQQNFQNSRELNSVSPTYAQNTLDGVENAANTVNTQMVNSPNNVIIGYSMGGVVAREMERTFSARVGGIVTVASPNKGVYIMNSIRNNQVLPTIEAGYNDLVAGPSADIAVNFATFPLIPLGITSFRELSDLFFWGLTRLITDFMPDATLPTAVDLTANSPYLSGINGRRPNIPVLNIICEENDDQGLRIAAAAIDAPEDAPLHGFDDGEYVKIRNQVASVYKGLKDSYNVLRWTGVVQYAYYNSLKNKYGKGENYLRTNYAADYNTIIGAVRTEKYTTYRYVYKCGGSGGLDPSPIGRSMAIQPLPLPGEGCDPVYDADCSPSGDDCRLVPEYYTATRRINEGSDGLVPLSTQRMNGMSNSDVYTAQGVNHLEVGNHPEMTRILNDIFEREEATFRRTERRN